MARAGTADARIRSAFERAGDGDGEFWSFAGRAQRYHAHGYCHYPAMMVPKLQSWLMSVVSEATGDVQHVIDPFVGAGTILTESMMHGLDFIGTDINPLAVLICKAKSGPLYVDAMRVAAAAVETRIRQDRKRGVDVDFPGIDKWFAPRAAIELSRIRRAILADDRLWVRRFLWVCLVHTVRLTSNDRTSTYKLHARPTSETAARDTCPVDVFLQTLRANIERMQEQRASLSDAGRLERGRYSGNVRVALADARGLPEAGGIAPASCDLLLTSPPYGDNTSTVPYGQFSYLALQWVHLADIDEAVGVDWLGTTREIDRRSLGGQTHLSDADAENLYGRSPTLERIAAQLADRPRDRLARVLAFFRDMDASLDPILGTLKPGAHMVWTIGNRRVGGLQVPTDAVLTELLSSRGAVPVAEAHRRIPHKTMATRNNMAETIRGETVLLMRKGSTP